MVNFKYVGGVVKPGQLEKIRLILSTCQDGTGQLARSNNRTLPGWRDFERAVALAFEGVAQESKAIYDVLIPMPDNPEIDYGISCKMRKLLKSVKRTGRVTIEVSNSYGKFWNALHAEGIEDYGTAPTKSGQVLIRIIESWHSEVSVENGGNVNSQLSFYLVLQWDEKTLTYQLYQYPLKLPKPAKLSWSAKGRRLVGEDQKGILIEWYGHSGGQFKYYPFVEKATWVSRVFKLEPLPENDRGYGLLRKVTDYYPELWEKACSIP